MYSVRNDSFDYGPGANIIQQKKKGFFFNFRKLNPAKSEAENSPINIYISVFHKMIAQTVNKQMDTAEGAV